MVKLAFILYDGVTTLDFAGMYDPLTRLRTMGFLPDLEYQVCAQKEKIRSSEGLELVLDMVGGNLSSYDYVLIPGGNGITDLMNNHGFPDWITVRETDPSLRSVRRGAPCGSNGHTPGQTRHNTPEPAASPHPFCPGSNRRADRG